MITGILDIESTDIFFQNIFALPLRISYIIYGKLIQDLRGKQVYIIQIKVDNPIPCGKVSSKTPETIGQGESIAIAEAEGLTGEKGLSFKVYDGACYKLMQGDKVLGSVWIYEHKGQ